MCSGIGPSKHLQAHGIPVVHDNSNVGENLQDHPAAVVSFKTPVKGVSVTSKLRLFGTGLTNPFPVLKWLFFKTGLLTSTGCDHGAFVRTAASTGQPDLQIRFLAARAVGPDGMTTFTQFRNTKNLVSIDEVLRPTLLIENIRAHVIFLCFSRMMDTRSRVSPAVPRVKAACVLSLPILTLGQLSMEDTSPTLPTS
jgi:choline dehydrogenase-like flavoprotein